VPKGAYLFMIKKIKENIRNFDTPLFTACIILAVIGLILVLSASKSYGSSRIILVQTVAFFGGVFVCLLMAFWDYEFLSTKWLYILGLNLFLLILVLIIGIGAEEVGGNSWIDLGIIKFQPAEIVKIGYIICFAVQLDYCKDDINNPKNIVLFILHFALIIGLIMLQPDFGTAMVFLAIFAGMLFVARISYKYIFAAFGAAICAAPLMWFFFLSEYQKDRIRVFLNPELDPLRSGYQVIQSKLAVGSGEIVGSGLFNGVQTQLGFLPAKHTDFIFSVACEELGFIGAVIIIGIIIFIIARCFYIASNAKNSLGTFIATGIGMMLLAQSFENICMTIGLMPVTGITLPFLSYGGSSLVTTFLAIGIVLNIKIRHRVINF